MPTPPPSVRARARFKALETKAFGIRVIKRMSRTRSPIPAPAPVVNHVRNGIKATKVAQLLFDVEGPSSDLPQAEAAFYAGGLNKIAPDGRVHDLGQVRKILAYTERGLLPSRVTVRFGPDDLQTLDTDDFKIVLDPMDAAVGQPTLSSSGWEPHTTAVMRKFVKPGMTVVDVGANVGWFSLLAASLTGPTGRVIAVEPWSENCRLILLSILENNFGNIELWPFALDSQQGWASFMTAVGSNAAFCLDSAESLRSGAAVIVPTFRLDDLLPAGTKVDYLKIDVEGAEIRVLRGAERTLEASRPVIVSEFSPEATLVTSQADGLEYLSWFTERNWSIQVINRHNSDLMSFPSAEALLDWWPAPAHMEDLLLLPKERQ